MASRAGSPSRSRTLAATSASAHVGAHAVAWTTPVRAGRDVRGFEADAAARKVLIEAGYEPKAD